MQKVLGIPCPGCGRLSFDIGDPSSETQHGLGGKSGRHQAPLPRRNAVTSTIHDRMPVILDWDTYDLWLDPGMTKVEAVSDLLKPCDARLMRCYPVSTRINHVANDGEECSATVEIAEVQNSFFS
jgi:hypothetical protein